MNKLKLTMILHWLISMFIICILLFINNISAYGNIQINNNNDNLSFNVISSNIEEIDMNVSISKGDWMIIDKSFPTVEEQQWQQINDNHGNIKLIQNKKRFFYTIGKYGVGEHRLKKEILDKIYQDYDQKPFNKINFSFKIWYSQKRCTRSYYLFDHQKEITLDKPEQWNEIFLTIDIINRNSLKKLNNTSLLKLNNADDCEDSKLALKEIRLFYNYINWNDKNDTIIIEEFKNQSKSIINMKNEEKENPFIVDKINLYQCNIDDNCKLLYNLSENIINENETKYQLLEFYCPFDIQTVKFNFDSNITFEKDDFNITKIENNWKELIINKKGLGKIKNQNVSFNVSIKTENNGVIALKDEKLNIIGKKFEINEKSLLNNTNKFLKDNKTTEIYFWHKILTDNNKLATIEKEIDSKKCYEINYIVNQSIINMNIFVQIDESKLYNLFNYQQNFNTNSKEEKLKFCLNDFIYVKKENLNDKSIEKLFIQLENENNDENLIFITINESGDNENEKSKKLNFFPYGKNKSWAKSIIPSIDSIIDESEKTVVTMKNIKSNIKYFIRTDWLNYGINNNYKLTDRPLMLSLNNEIKEIHAKLCDITNICQKSINQSSIKRENEKNVIYSFQFDQHQNVKSSHVNLHIEFMTDNDINEMKLEMINFGNPCQPESICPGKNFNCNIKDVEEYVLANNIDDVCDCKKGFDGSYCNQIDYCKKEGVCGEAKCVNLGAAYCYCDYKDKFFIYDEKENKCNEDKTAFVNKSNVYKFKNPSLIDLRINDICMNINISNNDNLKKLKFQFNDEVLIDIENLNIKQLNQLCLHQYLIFDEKYLKQDFNKLQIEFHEKDNVNVNFYNPDITSYIPINRINDAKHIHSIGSKIKNYDRKSKKIIFESEVDGPLILTTKWIENPYKNSKNIDQDIIIDVGNPSKKKLCFATDKMDCYKLENNFKKLTEKLKGNSDKSFRLEFYYDKYKGKELKFNVSILNPCWHDCSGNGTCIEVNFEHYHCDCFDGYYGDQCKLTKCNEKHEEICNKLPHKSKCIPNTKHEYECECPDGYQYNYDEKRCLRIFIEYKEEICGTFINDHESDYPICFIEKINENMKYLPKNFPKIDKNLIKSNKKSIYYTIKSGSRIDIKIRNQLIINSTEDICINFNYILTEQNARLNITFKINENGDEENIFQIFGIKSLSEKTTLLFKEDEMEKICLKELISLNKQKNLTKISSFSIITTFDYGFNDLTLLQINSIYKYSFEKKISSIPWSYVSHKKSDLKKWKVKDKKQIDEIFNSDTWMFKFPNKHWKYDEHDDNQTMSLLAKKTHTTGFAQIETQWIRQTLYNKAVLTIGLESKNLNYVNLFILNDDREILFNIGKFSIVDTEEQQDETNNIKFGEKKVIKMENFKINNETLYKIVAQFYYNDTNDNQNYYIFKMINFTFGDPCIKPEKGDEQICYNLDDELINTIKCLRTVQSNRSNIDYQCDCDFDNGAKGRNCENKDYCKYKYLEIGDKNRNKINGQEYCQLDGADCRSGQYDKYKFLCFCKNESNWFKMDEKKCKPIQPCLLDLPEQLEYRDCIDKDNNCECDCKFGYKKDQNDPNKCIIDDKMECDSETNCPDKQMICAKHGTIKLCKCPKGFLFDGKKCKSDYCRFPSLNPCQQYCKSIDEKPYYQCECDKEYYESNTNTTCKLNDNAPEQCKQCNGPNQICKDKQCECKNGYKMSSDGKKKCVIDNLKTACPLNLLEFDSVINRTVCDCNHKDLKDWWKQSNNGSCSLKKTVCDENELGNRTCQRLGALCILNSYNPTRFECSCPHGHLFPNKKLYEQDHILVNRDKSYKCRPVCEYPYYEQICSSIGGRCNPIKLWQELIKNNNHLSTKHCDCLPGLFRNDDNDICVQHTNVITYKMTHKWTVELQKQFEDKVNEMNKFLPESLNYFKIHQIDKEKKLMDYIDPENWIQAQIRSLKLNQKFNQKNLQEWNQLLKENIIRNQIQTMMNNFGIIENKYQLDVVRMDSNSNDEMKDQYEIIVYGIDIDSENKIKCFNHSDWCLIPYLQLALKREEISFEPCNQVDVCKGMSDCIVHNKSNGYFSCECNPNYFIVEHSYQFKTKDPLIISKNERCLAKSLCDNCTNDNQQCFEMDPILEKNGKWIKKRLCQCQEGYKRNSEQHSCINVCQADSCSYNGECIAVGNDYKCKCDDKHYGENCEMESNSNIGWIISIVILSLVTIASIGCLAYILLYKKKSTKNADPYPVQKTSVIRHKQMYNKNNNNNNKSIKNNTNINDNNNNNSIKNNTNINDNNNNNLIKNNTNINTNNNNNDNTTSNYATINIIPSINNDEKIETIELQDKSISTSTSTSSSLSTLQSESLSRSASTTTTSSSLSTLQSESLSRSASTTTTSSLRLTPLMLVKQKMKLRNKRGSYDLEKNVI